MDGGLLLRPQDAIGFSICSMDKAEQFLANFKALLVGYQAKLREVDQYDGMEEYIETDYRVLFPDGSEFDSKHLVEIIQEMGKE